MNATAKKILAQELGFEVVMNTESDANIFDVLDEDGECVVTQGSEEAAWEAAYLKAYSLLTFGGGEVFGMDA